MNDFIPFNRATAVGLEMQHLEAAVRSGRMSGDGQYGERCSEFLSEAHNGSRVLMTPSCTAALELTALLLRLEPGDEVIAPSFAFVTTISPFVLFGARPVFVDVCPKTLNLDMAAVESAISPRTRAVVALHYGGVSCDMDSLLALREQYGFEIIEDNAHGLFGSYRGKTLGTFGAAATQSFHETKNFSCGEGGALVIGRESWVERAEILREKGTDRSRFFRGQVDKYTWLDLGSSYLPSELQAAFLWGQFERRTEIQARRLAIWDRYRTALSEWAGAQGVGLPWVPEPCVATAHLFFLLLPSLRDRERLIEHLKTQNVLAVFHYQPLHLSEVGTRFGGREGDCPVSENAGDCLLRLPLYFSLSDDEQSRVIESVLSFSCSDV